MAPELWDEWDEYLGIEPIGTLLTARQLATLVLCLDAGGKLTEEAILRNWGFAPPQYPVSQAESNERLAKGFGG